jgi:DNA mismatch repair protein MutL
MGFSIEHFGGRTYTIRGVPAAVAGGDEKAFIHDVVDDLIREARQKGVTVASEQLLVIIAGRAAMAACRSAVKAGDAVSPEKLQNMVKRLFSTKNPFTCPHGRPTMIILTKKELERKFGRT